MINILGLKGNANQSNLAIPSHPGQNGYLQEHRQYQMLARM
jgi:hypothetical protein